MPQNDKSVQFLYGTKFGRAILSVALAVKVPALLGVFLRSPFSKFYIKKFVKKNNIDITPWKDVKFRSFNDFFTRKKVISFHSEPSSLISPADSFLSVYPIKEDSTFFIKGSDYTISDFLQNTELEQKFAEGVCLVFRLCASDYHRYCYIDNCHVEENHFIPGKLYSVQPLPCEKYRVYTKNRRSWNILNTENFGTVAQIEVGAFSVGGIKNHHENCDVKKGDEKGYFDLHGSTIVLLFEKNKIKLLPEVLENTAGGKEVKVNIGCSIGTKY